MFLKNLGYNFAIFYNFVYTQFLVDNLLENEKVHFLDEMRKVVSQCV